jgi:hypothetical protein
MYLSSLNINDLYSNGYASFRLDPITYQHLKKALDDDEWLDYSTIETTEKFKSVPVWFHDAITENEGHINDGRPDSLNDFVLDYVPESYLNPLLNLIKDPILLSGLTDTYEIAISRVAITNGCSTLPWHTDICDECDMFFLIYISDQAWSESDGGYLDVGVRDIQSNNLMTVNSDDSIKRLARLSPNNRQCVLINNRNPRFLHKVTEVALEKQNADRILINVGLTFVQRELNGAY